MKVIIFCCVTVIYLSILCTSFSSAEWGLPECQSNGGVTDAGASGGCFVVRRKCGGWDGAVDKCLKLGGMLAVLDGRVSTATRKALASRITGSLAYVALRQDDDAETDEDWNWLLTRTSEALINVRPAWDAGEPDDRGGQNEKVGALASWSALLHDAPDRVNWDYICQFTL